MSFVTVYKKCSVSCSHKLDLPYPSSCARLHGHNYTVEVWITGEPDAHGLVADFSHIKEVVNCYDHRHLNDLLTPATAECFALKLRQHLLERFLGKEVRVRVWETENCYAEAP